MTPRPTRGFLLCGLAAVIILLPAATAPLLAGQGAAGVIIVNKADVGAAELSAEEERLIRSYFDDNPDDLGEITPLSQGLRNKLAPGAPLPLVRTRQALPLGLGASLPPHQGLDYQVIGSDVVLFDTATHRIIAVLRDVLRGG